MVDHAVAAPRTIGSLFAGIGGLELGLEHATGATTLWQCEIDAFCRSVLATHWPRATRYEDVTTLSNPPPVDLICGGFPCQDISSAGKGAGLAGGRSGLWYQFARIISEARPEWVVVENVASGAKRWVDAVCAGLGQLGYETLPLPISAADVGAPHLRRRVFIVAHAQRRALRYRQQRMSGRRTDGVRNEGETLALHDGGAGDAWRDGPPFPPVCRVDDGISHRVDRLRALGDAVVPQCAEVVGHVINELCLDHQRILRYK